MAKCTHSLLKSPIERFIRDSVVYKEFAYRVDREKTSLQAYVEDNKAWWYLNIECVDSDYPGNDEEQLPPCSPPTLTLALPPSVEPSGWRDFEETSYKFTVDDDLAFPLFPGIPSSAYIGWHLSCTEHHISFGRRIGNVFRVRWKALARADVYDEGVYFYVDADVPFTGIKVVSDQPPSVEETLTQWFDLSEFASADKSDSYLWYGVESDEGA